MSLVENSQNDNEKSSNKKSDEEIVFGFFQKLSQKEKNNDLSMLNFIRDQKYGAEKFFKICIATILSVSQIKLDEVSDKIILKPIALSGFLITSLLQDFLTEILNYSISDFKEILKKQKELSKTPQTYKEILSKFHQGEFDKLQNIMPKKHAKRLSNSKIFKKIISDIKPYAHIYVDFVVFLSKNNNYDITDEEIDAINKLLNKKFKEKFYEKISKVNQTLEILKQEVQKDDFQNSSSFFELLLSQIITNLEKKLENKNKKIINTQNFSASDKKEIIQIALEAVYLAIEEFQPNNIEKLIKKTKKMI